MPTKEDNELKSSNAFLKDGSSKGPLNLSNCYVAMTRKTASMDYIHDDMVVNGTAQLASLPFCLLRTAGLFLYFYSLYSLIHWISNHTGKHFLTKSIIKTEGVLFVLASNTKQMNFL